MDEVKEGMPILDPAYRDVDRQPWLPARFEERIRRAWNTVTTAEIRSAGGDLDRLADKVHAKAGGGREHVRARLEEFHRAENSPRRPREDPLVRPGAPV